MKLKIASVSIMVLVSYFFGITAFFPFIAGGLSYLLWELE